MAITTNKKFLIAIILFLVLIAEGCVHMLKENRKMLTLDKAKIISEEKAKELGYDLTELEVIADELNLIWNQHRKDAPEGFYSLDRELRGRQYWAIYYRPKEINQVGGDLFVFIDKEAGTVIGYLRGQ
jgi:hypothetical protein